MHENLIQDLKAVAGTTPRLADLMNRAAEVIQSIVPEEGVAPGKVPYRVISELYNTICGQYLPPAKQLTPRRRAVLAQRWNEDSAHQSLEWWSNYFKKVAASDFLSGRRAPGKGHDNWRPNLDWIIKSENFIKVLEGSYDNRASSLDLAAITRER